MFEGITHIIFDLDGLLIDSEPLWQRAELGILEAHDRAWNDDFAKQHIGLRLDEAAATMVKLYDLPMSATELEHQIFDKMLQLIKTDLEPMPFADDLIKAASERYTLSIASSSAGNYIQAAVDTLGWTPYIHVMTSAYDVPLGKPAPDVYLAAIEQLGTDAKHCIAFEDSLNGAKAAYAAGIRTVVVPGHGFTANDFADHSHHVVDSLQAVIDAFN